MPQHGLMTIALRPARSNDFAYCRRIYFEEMSWIIEKLHLDKAVQESYFLEMWDPTQVRLITLDGADIGWIQTINQDGALFLAQMFINRTFQRRGIGTAIMKSLIGEAARSNLPMRLNVVKINPARRLYERLGFTVIHEDERKLYLQWDPSCRDS